VKYSSIDEYIRLQDEAVQPRLNAIRKLLKETVPDGIECISYNMPAIKKGKVLVYYAACRDHIGFYPQELKPYHTSKGAVQLPLKEELPLELIRKMVLYRDSELKLKSVSK
jgi:uncharacterized protein YdhG (YjbR/CyaY superfamily)